VSDLAICTVCGYIFERNNPRQIYRSRKCKTIRDKDRLMKAYWADIPAAKAKRAAHYAAKNEQELKKACEWRAAHPGRMREFNREWNRKNPKKRMACNSAAGARRSGAVNNAEFLLFQDIRKEFNSCAWCGKEGTETIDHVIPISESGVNDRRNLVIACRSCNSSKRNKDWQEWYRERPFYSERTERFIKDRLSSLGG
jgi:5-methylcytosine-specific restriction endonuclease McrA